MKARIKATGEIIEVAYLSEDKYGNKYYNVTTDTRTYRETELEMMSYKGDYFYTYDYWEKLKHQYAGMAMQGMLSNAIGFDEVRKQAAESGINNLITLIAGAATDYATALVEKLKEKEESK